MSPTDSPSGESETLEEQIGRLRALAQKWKDDGNANWLDGAAGRGNSLLVASRVAFKAADELDRLRAEVARLTEEQDENGAEIQRLCIAAAEAEARAARLEEALREIIEWAKYERTGLTARGANRIVATAEDALTEGGGRAEG